MRKRGSKELGRSPYIDFRPVGLLDFFLAVTRLAHLRAVNRTERFFKGICLQCSVGSVYISGGSIGSGLSFFLFIYIFLIDD